VAYRNEERAGGDLHVKSWPVTGSLWLKPLPALYLGGGVGWYQTTYDYAAALGIEDHTTQKFGEHLGGGLSIPLAPSVGVDLNGRYVFLQKDNSQLPPYQYNPDYWTTTLGLAFHF
jgi:opacity protein-like surface antigen